MPSLLYTDRYCISQSQRRWKRGDDGLVAFEMFIRRHPPDRGFMITAGLGTLLWWLEHLEFGREEWKWMLDNGYDPEFAKFIHHKCNNRPNFFTGDIFAIPEGTVVAPQTPILRVVAPRIEAIWIESMVLSTVNHQMMVASKAARMVEAAAGKPLWDFSMRRGHGPEASVGVARAAYIAGFAGTATVFPGMRLDIPTTGTQAHHDIMAEGPEHEQDVFEDTLREFPDNHALLVDTYDIGTGILRAITASKVTQIPLKAIRLDSGDLDRWSRHARAELDRCGCTDTKILASNDLDEYSIDYLIRDRAPIDGFGVGTRLATVPDAPNVGGVYKLVEQLEREPRYVMKLAEDKETDPGSHQVWRTWEHARDLLALAYESNPFPDIPDSVPLMQPVMRHGRALPQEDLPISQIRCISEVKRLHPDWRRLTDPPSLHLNRSERLMALRRSLGDRSLHDE